MAKEVFNRNELKYIVKSNVQKDLVAALKPYMCMDEFGDEEGFYSISNIYYDTHDYYFYQQNINRDVFRQKLRLRAYGKASLEDTVFLEIKKKYKGVVYKRRTLMKLKDAYRFLEPSVKLEDLKNFDNSNPQILREIYFLKTFYKLEPKMVLSYDRQAFQGINDPEVRVTFDRSLRSRNYDLRIEHGSYGANFVDNGMMLMEVKVGASVPLWLVRILNEFSCRRQRFSKYSACVEAEIFNRQNKLIV